jgi:hypothetical protein
VNERGLVGAARDVEIARVKTQVGLRRGRNIGSVAAAGHTLALASLDDGEIRCLAAAA